MDWRAQVQQVGPAEGRQASALDRIDAVLAAQEVVDSAMVVRRDVCDDGHLHADVSVWLLTSTRLVTTEVNDAHHLHAPSPHDGTSVRVVQIPLRAVEHVSVNSWVGEDGEPVALVSVAHRTGRGGGTLTKHECDDPDCVEGDVAYFLEQWDDHLELGADGDEAADLLRFAGVLGIAVADA